MLGPMVGLVNSDALGTWKHKLVPCMCWAGVRLGSVLAAASDPQHILPHPHAQHTHANLVLQQPRVHGIRVTPSPPMQHVGLAWSEPKT
jgi:hypothetical protein